MSSFQLGSAGPIEVHAHFPVMPAIFMFTTAVAFLGDRDVGQMNQAVFGIFSTLLGLVAGAAVESRYPHDVQYGGFWLTGFIISVIFYLAHRSSTRPSSGPPP